MGYSVRDSAGRERSCDSSQLRADRLHGVIGPDTRVRREGSETWRNVESVAVLQGWDDNQVARQDPPRVTTALTPLPDDMDPEDRQNALDWRSREVDSITQAAEWAKAAGVPPVPPALAGSVLLTQEAAIDRSFDPTPVTPHRISALDPTYPAVGERLRAHVADWALPWMLGAVSILVLAWFGIGLWMALAIGYATGALMGGLRLAVWEWQAATTPGKRLFHIEVVGSRFLPVSRREALWRNVIRLTFLLLPPLALLDAMMWLVSRQRCLHDRCSQTSCIRSAGVRPRSQAPARLLPSDWLRILTARAPGDLAEAHKWTSGSQFPSDSDQRS